MTRRAPITVRRATITRAALGLTMVLMLSTCLPAAPGDVLLAAERTALAAAGEPRDVTFDDLKLELKKGEAFKASLLTAKVKKLDGQPIRIRGYILPSFQETDIKQFVLVRDNMECCFGPKAALHDAIVVEMTGSNSTHYTVRPVSVAGRFTVHELLGPDGQHLAIYHLDGDEVK